MPPPPPPPLFLLVPRSSTTITATIPRLKLQTTPAAVNSNRSQTRKMQPEPTTPQGISLSGLSEEEQAFLLSMPIAPKVKTPALPKVSNKGTKRLFSDASNSPTPVAPDAEDSSSKHQTASSISDAPISSDELAQFSHDCQAGIAAAKPALQNKINKRPRSSAPSPSASTPLVGGTPISMSDADDQAEGVLQSHAAFRQNVLAYIFLRSNSTVHSPVCLGATAPPDPSASAAIASFHHNMPPPAAPARIILGVPSAASPPRTLAGNPLPCPAYLSASNVRQTLPLVCFCNNRFRYRLKSGSISSSSAWAPMLVACQIPLDQGRPLNLAPLNLL
jgi:hypothetical protein